MLSGRASVPATPVPRANSMTSWLPARSCTRSVPVALEARRQIAAADDSGVKPSGSARPSTSSRASPATLRRMRVSR